MTLELEKNKTSYGNKRARQPDPENAFRSDHDEGIQDKGRKIQVKVPR